MKNFKFVFATILFLGIFLQSFAQNDNVIYYMDSLHVINNAIAKKSYSGQIRYVMMPTLYNTTVANGNVCFITINASTLQMTTRYYYTQLLKGAVINDIHISTNGRIQFAGTQNGHGIYGELLSSGIIKKIRYDAAFNEITAMTILPLSNNESILFCGQNNANKAVHGLHSTSSNIRKIKITDNTYTNKSVKDITHYIGGMLPLQCGGIMLRYNSSSQVDIIPYNASAIGTSNQSKTINIPTDWQWHEGGGAIAQVSDLKFIAAIDVRNLIDEIDGVFFIKFSVNSLGQVSVYDTHIISMPSPKVVVKDILYVNDPNYNDVSYNVIGQYIINGGGHPFVLKTDTTFSSYYALEYMTSENCTFQLNKAIYYDNVYPVIAVGDFDACSGTFNTGGIYLTRNMPGAYWYNYTNCETPITLSSPTTLASHNVLALSSGVTDVNSLPYDSVNFVLNMPSAGKITLCNKNDLTEEKSYDKNVSNEFFFHVQGNKIFFEITNEENTFEIYNIMGKQVMKGQAIGDINITPLSKGLYILRVMNNEKIISTDKFVK